MTPTQKMKTTYLLLLSFVLLLSGCEITSSDLTEVDENGNRVNNKEIRIGASLLDVGMTAYTIDTVCTELILTRQKGGAVRISGFRKGTVIYDENGAIDSIAWDWRRPEINYGYDYRYVWDDLEYRILSLQDNGFVEDMEIWRRGKDGERDRLVAQLIGYMDFQARGQNLKYGFVLALIDAARKNTLLIGIYGIDGVVVNAGLRIVKAHG